MPYPERRSDRAALTAHRTNGARPIWRNPTVHVLPRRSSVRTRTDLAPHASRRHHHSPQAPLPPAPSPRWRRRPAAVDPRPGAERWEGCWVGHWPADSAPGAEVAPPEAAGPELA